MCIVRLARQVTPIESAVGQYDSSWFQGTLVGLLYARPDLTLLLKVALRHVVGRGCEVESREYFRVGFDDGDDSD